MIYIYLCEDKKEQLDNWQEIIENYLLMHPINAAIVCAAQTPNELLNVLDVKRSGLQLYFLDICLNEEKNGFQLASEIRKQDPLGEIVFITSHSELSCLSFEYQTRALDIITKDNILDFPEKIGKCIRIAAEKEKQIHEFTTEPLQLKLHGDLIYFNPDDILYIQISPDAIHKITIYTISGVESIYRSLKDMEHLLEQYGFFSRCSKSTIVNTNHIAKINRITRELTLSSGATIPVSIRFLRSMKRQ